MANPMENVLHFFRRTSAASDVAVPHEVRRSASSGDGAGADADLPDGESAAESRSTERNQEDVAEFNRIAPDPVRYLEPSKDGKCWLLSVPEEVLVKVFGKLGRNDLSRCMRICKDLNTLINSNTNLALQHLLQSSSLRVNPNALIPLPHTPHHVPPSPAQLLEILRGRLDRMSTMEARKVSDIRLKESDGNLYEYLEGILLRGVGGGRVTKPRELAVYDLRKLADWEDEEGDEVQSVQTAPQGAGAVTVSGGNATAQPEVEDVLDEEDLAETLRTSKKFDFDIAEFAVDPGQDLLVLVQVKTIAPQDYQMVLHLHTLSTFEKHPLAPHNPLEWPVRFKRKKIQLGFQICDDGLFVLYNNIRAGTSDQLCGWQWTTGRLAVTLRAFPTMSFESFVLLSPSSFVMPTILTRLDAGMNRADQLNDPSDLFWSHHLYIYAFPPFSSIALPTDPSEPMPPPHTPTLSAVLDMPEFTIDLARDMPPPRMSIRTDPPPRHSFPTHPEGHVQLFVPDPESGAVIMEFQCQSPDPPWPHYVLVCPKRTLLQYVPAKDNAMLREAWPRSAPVVKWETLAPKVRMFGPDLIPSSWVCYVYGDRYVTPIRRERNSNDADDEDTRPRHADRIRLYDFEPLRVKREHLKRVYSSKGTSSSFSETATATAQLPPSTTRLIGVPTSSGSSPTASPTRPREGSFLRRLSSSFKRTRLVPPEPHSDSDAAPETASTDAQFAYPHDGERGGIHLVTAPNNMESSAVLPEPIPTGSELPYMYTDQSGDCQTVLLDDERMVMVYAEDDPEETIFIRQEKTALRVWEF